MKSKYIKFVKIYSESTKKTDVFAIVSKNDKNLLGKIKWYPWWRQYAFFPTEPSVFNPDCLRDICTFIDGLMEKRKQKRTAKRNP